MHGYGKRLLSFLLAMVMVFSLVPMQAFAEETGHDHEHTEETQTAPETQTQSETEDTGDAEVTDTEVTDTEVTDTEVTDTEVTDTEVTDTEITDTEVTDTEVTDTEVTDTEVTDTEGTGTEGDDVQEDTTQETESVNPAITEFQAQIDDMLGWYLNGLVFPKGPLTEEEREALRPQIEDIVANVLTSDDIWMAQVEIYDLEEAMLAELTEDEIQGMIDSNPVLCDFADLLNEYSTGGNVLTTTTVLDGRVSITDSANKNTVSGNTVTLTVKGSLFGKSTNNITITNETAEKAKLGFDYSVASASSFKIAGATAASGGSYSVVLEAGASLAITLVSNSGISDLTATLTINNITLTTINAASDVTFEFDGTYGSVTVGGEAVTSGGVKNIDGTSGAALVATPVSGASFLGWVDAADGKILSTGESYTLLPANAMTVKAVFVGANSAPWFAVGSAAQKSVSSGFLGMSKIYYYTVGTSYLFDDLNAAAAKAASDAANKTVVLMNSGTLPAGTYTIPAGVTLLIPYDDANTMYTTQVVNTGTYTKPTAYRTLTMSDGANLDINGSVSLSAVQKYANGGAKDGGAPTGPVSFIRMQGNSNITVNNGGTLYAYGFITGSGSVVANSGGTVYEMFQFSDFRGGTQSTKMENGVFPLSQYYVQNIEVPLTLYSGATEYSYTTIYMSSADFGSSVKFISNNDAMFNLTSGYVIKKYDGSKDRLVVEAYGNLTLASITMDVGGQDINSKDYELPINSNITVTVKNGSNITINQDVAMLPGSEIVVDEGANCTVGSGYNIYIYDADQWSTYAGSKDYTFVPVAYAPGKIYTRTDADLVDASICVNGTVDASKGYVYTTSGGANIYSTGNGVANVLSGTQTVTYQLRQTTSTYDQIPITPAKLKNADGSYTETAKDPNASDATEPTEYTYADGVWSSCKHDNAPDATCTAPSVCPDCKKEVAPALGHSWNDATCTVPKTCSVCGATEGEALGHTWADATCTVPKTCSVCGATEGEALGHTWADATCTVPKTCSVCGATEGEALGHTWVDATCTAPKTCSVCDATEGVALPHTEVSHEAKAPTCTEKGWDAYVTCSKCDYTTYVEKAATGHKWTDATCTAPKTCSVCGATEGEALGHSWNAASCTAPKTCSRCGTTEGEALGHSWTDATCITPKTCSRCDATEGEALGHSWKDATCTAPKTCSRCDATEGEALGHSWNTASCTAPKTCSRCGATEGAALGHSWTDANCTTPKTCSVCGATEGEALGHSWKDATCTAPKTCSRCDATEGVALGHSWKDATCTAPKTCSRCDATEGEALGHSWVAATCTEPKTCSRCGAIDGDAPGHNLVIDAAKAPSCTETGLTEGKHCDRCDYVEIEQTVIAALGHTPGDDATCTAAQTCTVCGAELEGAKGHTVVIDKAVAPTCTATGLTEGEHCSECGEVLTAQTVVDALGHAPGAAATCTADQTCTRCGEVLTEKLGHAEIEHEAKAPTCTAIGWDAYVTCSRCSYTTYVEKEATGHNKISHEAQAPTCTEIGWDAYETCSKCDYSTYAEKAALGHAEIEHEAKAPTCTEIGWDAYVTCSRCDYTTKVEKEATGHTEVPHEAKAPTCTEIGWDAYVTCSKCDYTTKVEKEALGHDEIAHSAQAPTCTEKGWDAYVTCSRCDYTTKVEKPELGHDKITHEAQAPTCTEKGWDAYETCSRCSYTTYVEKAALGHAEVPHAAQAPTCTEKGWKAYVTCSRCSYTTYEEIAATGHTEVSHEAKAPTCTETGWDAYVTCSECDYTTKVEKAALGHAEIEHEAKAPTCTEIGWDAYVTCSRCSYTTYAEKAELGHNLVTDAAVAPTCTETGLTEGSHCDRCPYVAVAQEPVDALGHSWNDGVYVAGKEPTCTATGTSLFTCLVCGAAEEREAAELGHDMVYHDEQKATCTEEGFAAGGECSRCGHVTGNAVIPALGHDWGEGTVTKDPTCTEVGVRSFTCSRCGETKEEDEPALGHDKVSHEAKAPTCTEIGWDAYETCNRCDYTTYAEKSELGHDEEAHAAQAPTCTEIGWDAYVTCSRCDYTTYVEKAALNHDLTQVEAKAPTCTEIGWEAYEKCSRCDYTTYKERKALGHDAIPHGAKAPTCTEIGWDAYETCSRCDHTTYNELPALNHDLTQVEAKAPTCTEIGWEAYEKCSRCDYTTYAEKAALNHDAQQHAGQAATCTEKGWKAYVTCSRCDYTTYEEIAATGHNKVTHEAQAPTCTAIGWDAYETCSKCDYTTYAEKAALGHTPGEAATCTTAQTCTICGDELAEALGHTEVIDEAKAPTCTETGLTEGVHCSVCDEVLVAQTVVDALGHTEVIDEAKAPTCTETGLTEGVHCSVCDAVLTAQTVVDALGHTEVIDKAVAPTCTETGLTEGVHCSVCDAVLTAQNVVDALGHTDEVISAKDPTCTETGLTAGIKCAVCGEILKAQETVKELGHTEEVIPGVEPTCTTTGWTSGKKCSVCDKTLEAQQPISALGHTEVNDARVEPTCTETGLTAGKHCDVCGAVTVEQKVIAAPGHTEEIIPAVAPTCTKTGMSEGVKCSVCNAMIVGIKTVEATGHTEEEIPAVEPSCTETGLTAGIKCSVCDEILKAQETVKELGHTEVIDEAKEPTCTETGLTEGVHCSVCDEVLTAQTVVEALGHTEETISAVEPTCTETGLTAGIKCSVCDEILKAQETVKALGHTEETIPAVEPTCTETGLSAGVKCSVCDEILKAQETVKALGHTEVIDEAKEPTCTETGLTEGVHCSVCDEVLTAQTVVEALGHTEETIPAVEPTCTETGLTAGIKCAVCGEILKAQETVKALGHTEEVIPAVEPTCTETGLTAGVKCSVCGEILTAQEEVAALDHDMGEATCAAPATCKREGCGHTEGVALEHTVVEDEEVPAMCGVPGLTSGKHCSVCGKVLEKQLETAALEHNIEQHEAKRATYTAVGWEAYEDCTRCGYTTYVAIPMLETPPITDYETFLTNLQLLEELAYAYIQQNPGKDPAALVIKYIRTGVDRYNSGSWGIMAGYEDAGFAKFVAEMEDMINCQVEDESQMICVSSLKDIASFTIPNGDTVDFGHMFGTMDITYHNNFGINHADVAGWAGDLVDLLSTADRHSVTGTVEEMVADLSENYLCHSIPGESDQFSLTDMYGDMDGYYVMKVLENTTYETGVLTQIMQAYFTADLSDEQRADYMIRNRFNGVSTRNALREAVYTEYTSNKVISTLEGTREFAATDLTDMRYAVCYSFADYLCRLAGDFVDVSENPFFTVFSSEYSVLAPGITQEIKMATSADGKQMVYYLATADLTREDVNVYANYNNNDPAAGWAMQRVLDQANAAQNKYGDPESEYYIENYNVITSINGAGFNMSTGEPGGLLVMGGVEYQGINSNGFFGILKDGTPVIGTTEEYNTIYKGQVAEGIAGFGSTLVKDGEICITASSNYYTNRASRTAVGITRTGKVVFMVLDGRQEPWSCGGSMEEIAQIMLEAGCVHAINLDGGGSTTYVARQAGDEELSVVSRPSDGVQRSVSTTLMMVSTAPSSTAFDHALLETTADYMTVGATVQITPVGVSATGNTAELPEGTTWEVSDERWAAITEDGTLTALRYGDVTVNLLLGEEIIGTKVIHIVRPDQIYFTKDSISATYGVEKELPVKALYEGKEVAITPSDVTFTVSPEGAGTVDTFTFTGNEESGIKTAKITAALAHDDTVSASISVTMYKHGENSFDFDKATGGDRLLAWERQVSNSTTDDAITYYVVDESQPMVTSYILAMDMTQIPIPQKLNDLIYMLPGSDASDASAWNFLLQLAERISVLTEVRPTIQIDPNFYVDYSELTVITDYFQLNEIIYDEEASTLTMVLNWIDQTQPIDPATANPLCIVKGLKLIPKDDADWGSKNRLTAVLTGEISYSIYMRASSLYSFCQKPENQETFGLKPFINPNDPKESGGYFSDVYITFEDTYTLVNALKNGWVNEDGGYAYYVDGQRLTGINLVDGLYYDFGEEGINVGKKPYTGLFEQNGNTYYAKLGELAKGWHAIGDGWYLFDWHTGVGEDGIYHTTIEGVEVTYEFENARIVKGFWHNDGVGLKYFYGPYYFKQSWRIIDGETYFFEEYYALTGVAPVQEGHSIETLWYEFTEDGKLVGPAADGLYWYGGELYYVVNQLAMKSGLYLVDGDYYYFQSDETAIRGRISWISNTRGLVEAGTYRFAEDGKMIMTTEIVNENGTLYYYHNGKRTGNAGVVEFNGAYYYIESGAIAAVNKRVWVGTTNGLVEVGTYRFDADGKMIMYTGILEEDGVLYYYKNGRRTPHAGLIEFEGSYYFIDGAAKAVINETIWVSNTNGLWPENSYTFGPDGKMIIYNGIVNGYYYVEGIKTAAGLIHYVDGNYYFAGTGGKLVTEKSYWVNKTNGLLPEGTYRFDAEGKAIMTTELVNENGTLYYYRNGKRTGNAGLLLIDGDYYYIESGAIAAANKTTWVGTINGLPFTAGNYRFDTEGRMIITTEVVDENGTLYYYKNGRRTAGAGIVEQDGYYYFIDGAAKAVVSTTMAVPANKTNGLIPAGTYTFAENGKLYLHHQLLNGYYYYEGEKSAAGLVKIGDDYYYAGKQGELTCNEICWVSKTNDLLPVGTYRFGADGKVIMTTEIVDENGTLYYYENGKRTGNAGLLWIDGHYYYVEGGAIAAANKTAWVATLNGHSIPVGTYRFDSEGKMIMTTEVTNENGTLYYYKDGKRTANAGLVLYNGSFYYIDGAAKAVVNTTIKVTKTNGLMDAGTYTFGEDGKMIMADGIINGYYYENGARTFAGVVKVDDDYYYAGPDGKLAVSQSSWISKTNGLLPQGTYRFDANGKIIMIAEIVNENGTLYYYKDGKRTGNAGLLLIDDNYYYIEGGAIAAANKTAWVATLNGISIPVGTYRFDSEGRMVMTTEIVNENGTLYYYKNGKRTANAGLLLIDGEYYYIDGSAKAVTGSKVWVEITNGLMVKGYYSFDAEGKMIQN